MSDAYEEVLSDIRAGKNVSADQLAAALRACPTDNPPKEFREYLARLIEALKLGPASPLKVR